MKKIISALGLLSVATPTALTVVACSNLSNDIENVIKTIEEITTLTIDIRDEDDGKETTVFTILNHENEGIGIKLTGYSSLEKKYQLRLFALDLDNIYFDAEGEKKVSETDTINTLEVETYYFRFTYSGQQNNILMPVRLVNNERKIADAFENVETYAINTVVGFPLEEFKKTVDENFIKNNLDDEIQNIFDDKKLKNINIKKDDNTELTEADLAQENTIEGHIVFDYGTILNIEVSLIINVQDHQKIVDAVDNITYTIDVLVNSKVSDLIQAIDGSFIQESLPVELQQEFNIYLFKFDSIQLDGAELNDSHLKNPKEIETKITYHYGEISGNTTLAIDIK